MKTNEPGKACGDAVLVFEELPLYYLGLKNVILEAIGNDIHVIQCHISKNFTKESRRKNIKCILISLPHPTDAVELSKFVNKLKRKFGNSPVIAYSYEFQAKLLEARLNGVDAIFNFAETPKTIVSLIDKVVKGQNMESM